MLPPISYAASVIQPLKYGDYQKILKAAAPDPTIVFVWEIDCAFCKQSMPVLDRLLEQYPHVQLRTIATDSFDKAAQLAEILNRFNLLRYPAWSFADSSAWLRKDIDRDWPGTLPRTYLFDNNQQKHVINGRLDEKKLGDWMRSTVSDSVQ
jgi:thiol-disulfide isomerase/thioredoxin